MQPDPVQAAKTNNLKTYKEWTQVQQLIPLPQYIW